MKEASVLYENDSYGRGLADAFRKNFRGTIISFASPPTMLCTCSWVSVRFDAFAAAKTRSTISSVAGRPRLSSQKTTFDFPDIGPTSISCCRPTRLAGTAA